MSADTNAQVQSVPETLWRDIKGPVLMTQVFTEVSPDTTVALMNYTTRTNLLWTLMVDALGDEVNKYYKEPLSEESDLAFGMLVDQILLTLYDKEMKPEVRKCFTPEALDNLKQVWDLPYENAKERAVDLKRSICASKRRRLLNPKVKERPSRNQRSNRRVCRFLKSQVTLDGDTLHVHGPYPFSVKEPLFTQVDAERLELVSISKKPRREAERTRLLNEQRPPHTRHYEFAFVFVTNDD